MAAAAATTTTRAEVCSSFLLPQLFGTNPRSHHKDTTGRVQTGDRQDIPTTTATATAAAAAAAAATTTT